MKNFIKWWFLDKEGLSPAGFFLAMLHSGLTFGATTFISIGVIYPGHLNLALFCGFISFLVGIFFTIWYGL